MQAIRPASRTSKPVPSELMMSDSGVAIRNASLSEGFSVVVPAYNEEQGIGRVLDELRAAPARSERPWEILVVNDGSTDNTAQIVSKAGIPMVDQGANLGYGASLKNGIRRATYDLIVITDGDGTYPVSEILGVVEAMDAVDMVVAARTGEKVRVPVVRRPAKWCLRKVSEYLAGVQIPDLNSGLRCFRRSTVREYMHLLPNGFSFTTTITLAYHVDSRLVRYIPVNYEKRAGSSKIRPLADTYNFILLILRTVMYFDPMRIFMPPAVVSFGITTLTLGYDIVELQNLTEKSLIWLMMTILLFGLALVGDLIVKRR